MGQSLYSHRIMNFIKTFISFGVRYPPTEFVCSPFREGGGHTRKPLRRPVFFLPLSLTVTKLFEGKFPHKFPLSIFRPRPAPIVAGQSIPVRESSPSTAQHKPHQLNWPNNVSFGGKLRQRSRLQGRQLRALRPSSAAPSCFSSCHRHLLRFVHLDGAQLLKRRQNGQVAWSGRTPGDHQQQRLGTSDVHSACSSRSWITAAHRRPYGWLATFQCMEVDDADNNWANSNRSLCRA